MALKGTRTEQNLLKAFAGESQARNRYTYFASAAKKEGFEQISAIFIETADNEKEHAKVFFKYLEGGDAEITATYPAGTIGTTAENLLAAAEGEKMEWGTLYPDFAAGRRGGGLRRRRRLVPRDRQGRGAARGPLPQAARERRGRQGLQAATRPTSWKCRNCGYVHEGPEAPDVCPACKHPQAYYELLAEPY